ncbi:hypothetical protein [Aureliella helgolandensis]|uniref:Uncharacterized protein n=1 Tax=Aureliella helgolandensis TaxID=2527968 RepID=A0A518G619_9BACT|nr:hypothetical protein [Aureliella helgolandensis]QDV24037.1 hypothetical protein Q31a_23500 [Aureliella helgolandensis]
MAEAFVPPFSGFGGRERYAALRKRKVVAEIQPGVEAILKDVAVNRAPKSCGERIEPGGDVGVAAC